MAGLTDERADHDHHEQEHAWRRGAIDAAWDQLDGHWTDVALACVRADPPLADGVEPLRLGRRYLTEQLARIEAALPRDRGSDRDLARTEARAAISARAAAEQQVAAARVALAEQTGRRWPRRDSIAIGRSRSVPRAATSPRCSTRRFAMIVYGILAMLLSAATPWLSQRLRYLEAVEATAERRERQEQMAAEMQAARTTTDATTTPPASSPPNV